MKIGERAVASLGALANDQGDPGERGQCMCPHNRISRTFLVYHSATVIVIPSHRLQ